MAEPARIFGFDGELADSELRSRLVEEWNSLGIVLGLFSVVAVTPFYAPPAALLDAGDPAVAIFGYFSGMAFAFTIIGVLAIAM